LSRQPKSHQRKVTVSCQFTLFGSFEIFILILLGAKAKDVVVQVVTALKDCPLFNAGKGAALIIDGEHEPPANMALLAALREPKTRFLLPTQLPPLYDRRQGSRCLSEQCGLELDNNDFLHLGCPTPTLGAKKQGEMGTVGAITLAIHGNIAAAGSTGGTPGKSRGTTNTMAKVSHKLL
jgi:hypothetical protein